MKPIISFIPDKRYLLELLRPWKLVTFGVSMAWLIYGGLCYGICDWDVGVSLIMGGLTYVCAPWSVLVIYQAVRLRQRHWQLHVAAALVLAVAIVDWVYWLYHTAMGNTMLRWENFKVSMALYFICGIGWCYRGTVREFFAEVRDMRRNG